MLQAVVHHKLRGEIRVQMYGGTRRDAPEDLITSTVFGPLRYLPTHDVWDLCRDVFPLSVGSADDEAFRPTHHKVCFWPSLEPSDSWRAQGHDRVEPDAVLIFTNEAGRQRVYLIEVKWGAPLSNEQLRAQLDAAKEEWGLAITQVLLTRDSMLDANAKQQINDTGCTSVTWRILRDRIRPMQSETEQMARWAKDVGCFLQKLGLVTFTGFTVLPCHVDPRIVVRWQVRQFRFQALRQVSAQRLGQIRSWRIQHE